MLSRRDSPYRSAIFILLIAVTEFQRVVEGETISNCTIQFTDDDTKLKTFQDCATKHKYEHKVWNITFEEYENEMKDLMSKKFEDNCFTKCLYDAEQLLDKQGNVIAENFDKYFKMSNISTPLLKDLGSKFKDCSDETASKFKESKEIPCKMYAMNEFCYFSKIKENIKQLDELCYK